MNELEKLMNIGPVTAEWLRSVGIETRHDLAQVGAVGAWRILKGHGYPINLVGLYALAGALCDTHWNELPPRVKEELKSELKVVNI